jgi:uncharacterized membrane protein YbhN (UPF0104 family)
MNRALVTVGGVLISAVALLLAFARVDLHGGLHLVPRVHAADLKAALTSAHLGWLAGFVVLNLSSVLPRSWQLQTLARRRDGTAPSFVAAYHACAVALLAQNVLPARLSEAARVVALGRADDVSPANAAAAVVFGRVLDLIGLILVVCVPSILLDVPAFHSLHTVAIVGIAVGAALVCLLLFLYRHRARLSARAARLGPRAGRAASGFLDGLSALGAPRRLFAASLASLTAPLVIAACYTCALRAFGMTNLPPGSSLVLVATVLFAIAIPSAPSSVGVYHAAVTWLLPTLGATPAQAAAFAIATHAIGVVSFIALGSISLFKIGGTLFPR